MSASLNPRRSTWLQASREAIGTLRNQKREDQGNCRRAKSKDRIVAAGFHFRQKELVGVI
jgi:hypothetical protein